MSTGTAVVGRKQEAEEAQAPKPADPLKRLGGLKERYTRLLKYSWDHRKDKRVFWDEMGLGPYGADRLAWCYDNLEYLRINPEKLTAKEYEAVRGESLSYLNTPERKRCEMLLKRLETAVPQPKWKASTLTRSVGEIEEDYGFSTEPRDFREKEPEFPDGGEISDTEEESKKG